jgi:hypothetical protein
MPSLMSFSMDFGKARDIITMYLVMIIILVLVCQIISLDLVSSSSSSFQNSRLVHIHKECWMASVSTEYLATQQFSSGYPLYTKSIVSDHIAQCLTCVVMTYEDLCSFYNCFAVCGIMTILVPSVRILTTTYSCHSLFSCLVVEVSTIF